MTFRFEQRWSDGPEVVIQEKFIGLGPVVLIEPKVLNDEIVLHIITVDLDSAALVDLLEGIAEAAQGLPGVNEEEDPDA